MKMSPSCDPDVAGVGGGGLRSALCSEGGGREARTS